MATNWKKPTGADLAKVLNLKVIKDANENIDADSQAAPTENQTYDPDAENRRDQIVKMAVSTFRGAVQDAGRYPLSVDPDAVPPEAERHVLNLAAYQMICSTPNIKMIILTEKGAASPFKVFYDEATAYMKAIAAGKSFAKASDPTGMDYETAVSDTNPPLRSIFSAPINGPVDLSTDGSESGKNTEGTAAPNGTVTGTVGDVWIQRNEFGEVLKVWEKSTGVSTNTGWI